MLSVYEAWLEQAAERNDWGLAISPVGPSYVLGDDWRVEVNGMDSAEQTAAVLIHALEQRDLGLCSCLGAGVYPSENGPYLTPCPDCREPNPSDRTPSDAAVALAAARSLK
jgi:hypothetical protein